MLGYPEGLPQGKCQIPCVREKDVILTFYRLDTMCSMRQTFHTVVNTCKSCFAFCVTGLFNLNGRNDRTTAFVDLHRTRDRCGRSKHTVVSN